MSPSLSRSPTVTPASSRAQASSSGTPSQSVSTIATPCLARPDVWVISVKPPSPSLRYRWRPRNAEPPLLTTRSGQRSPFTSSHAAPPVWVLPASSGRGSSAVRSTSSRSIPAWAWGTVTVRCTTSEQVCAPVAGSVTRAWSATSSGPGRPSSCSTARPSSSQVPVAAGTGATNSRQSASACRIVVARYSVTWAPTIADRRCTSADTPTSSIGASSNGVPVVQSGTGSSGGSGTAESTWTTTGSGRPARPGSDGPEPAHPASTPATIALRTLPPPRSLYHGA